MWGMGKFIVLIYCAQIDYDCLLSDPLILDNMEDKEIMHISFRFEPSWIMRADFLVKVDEIWNEPDTTIDSLDVMQTKLKKVSKYLRCHGRNLREQVLKNIAK